MDHHDEYSDTFVAGLEWMWGAGFMSPGGPAEVEAILNGLDLTGKRVLDIGCGIGGIDVLLVQKHGAAHVTGIDVEAPLIERANRLVRSAGLSSQVSCQLVEPGPELPFADGSFDLVFSKDSIIHIPEKAHVYAEMFRVLAPNGRLAFSDWYGSHLPKTAEFVAWYDVLGLTFEMAAIEDAAEMVKRAGFSAVEFTDRNAWYAENIKEEVASISGENYGRLVEHLGEDAAAQRLKSSSLKQIVVKQGLLRPGHVRGFKDDSGSDNEMIR